MLIKTGHSSCTHKQYAVSCGEYEAMIAAAAGDCQMCWKPTVMSVIDHDHALGQWAVRGLLCTSCNVILGRIEGGRGDMTPTARRYLTAPWHQVHGWTAARGGFRERRECADCGREVGLMLNGIPYLHRAPMSQEYCTGTTLEEKAWRSPKTMRAPSSSLPFDPSLQPWFRDAVATAQVGHRRPNVMADPRNCTCGHAGTAHEVNQRCLAAGDWWDCPCIAYKAAAQNVADRPGGTNPATCARVRTQHHHRVLEGQ